ncbi:hypothetical protein [Winogradskya humida]|uniref:Transmembrane protein PGPGW n=1 Tax=Winogradskya humida TaxID=113566 RepID=A0ABQ4A797_9ACTN|nr:hypothetical protein [Actinoplanes humidus]GIE26725.1 hypothetical protein Ahu01nite_098270 [Actinoplanes humidus]
MSEDPMEGEPIRPRRAVQLRRPLLRSPWRLLASVIAGLLGLVVVLQLCRWVFAHPVALLAVAVLTYVFRGELRAVVLRWRR